MKGKLTRFEKRAVAAGDKTVLYEKLGILDDSDI